MTVQSLPTKTTGTADSKNNNDGPSLVPCNTNKRRYCKQKTKQNMRSLYAWLLLLFLMTAIGWVCGFTIYSSHTNFTRKHVYPFFESTYFQHKEGARIFTYLGIFYLIPGFVVLSSRSKGIDLPRPIPQLVRHFKIGIPSSWCSSASGSYGGGGYWSVLEILAVLLFVSVQVLTFASRVWNRFDEYWIPERVWYEVSKCLGKACALTLSIIFLPISKNCFWMDVFNYKFERAIKFHRWLGWFFTLIVLVHAGTAITSLVMADQFGNCMVPNEDCEMPGGWGNYKGLEISRIITYGWISFLVLFPLIITSMPWFRRHRFEWFYYIHFMFIPFIVLIHLHYKDMICYTAPGIAAYVLDKVVWWLSTRRPSKIIALSSPAPGFVRMLIAVDPNYKFEPGSWVQIKVPAISKWQWHPMSIASAPDGQSSTISIDIKVLGNWTKNLEKLSKRFNPSQPMHRCVYVEQYQGSSHRRYQGYLNDHPVVLMFAGGIGVTPMISALRDIILEQQQDGTTGSSSKKKYYSHIRRIVFVWCVKKKSVLNLYKEELEQIQSLGQQISSSSSSDCCEVDIHVNITLSEPEPEEGDQDNIEMTKQQQLYHPNLIHEEEDINDPKDQLQSEPLREYVFGYSHTLVLTMAAGFGVLLGIFVVNVLAYEKTPSWRVESKSMLQLFLSCLFSAILVAVGMSGSFLSPISSFENTLQHENETDGVCLVSKKKKRNKTKGRSSKSRKVVEKDYTQYHDDDIELQMIEGRGEAIQRQQQQQPEEVEAATTSLRKSDGNGKSNDNCNNLHIILGKRPNVPKFIKHTQKYCIKNDYKSVGVSVCGPDAMVDSVMDACKNASSSSCCCCSSSIASTTAAGNSSSSTSSTCTNVQFVVDDEVFDW